MVIDWESEDTTTLVNPRLPSGEKDRIASAIGSLPSFKRHIWLATSGTTSVAKWAALSKEALLCSAAAVNRHLQADRHDVWINPLPDFHVGGLGIWARSFLSGAKCIPFTTKWDPATFYQTLLESKATLTALVPTQVHDLIQLKLRVPEHLRAIVVGGGRLSDVLYRSARELGWPLLPSYGMTECCSQVATARLTGATAHLAILDHMDIRINPEGLIAIHSPALLSVYALISSEGVQLEDPKQGGWFVTSDRGTISEGHLEVLGRQDDVIKIGGESVDFAQLERILDELRGLHEMALVPMTDARLGHAVHLCVVGNSGEDVLERFNDLVLPYERIRKVHVVGEIPKTPLGKVKKQELILVVQEG